MRTFGAKIYLFRIFFICGFKNKFKYLSDYIIQTHVHGIEIMDITLLLLLLLLNPKKQSK